MFYIVNKDHPENKLAFTDEMEAEAVCDSMGRDEFEAISDEPAPAAPTEDEIVAHEAFLETLGVH